MEDDDQGLGAVFQAAAVGAPPPGFDHADVVRASVRAVARRRSVLVGAATALVVLVGAGGIGALVAQQRTATATAAGSEQVVEGAAPDAAGPDAAGSNSAGSADGGSGGAAGTGSGAGAADAGTDAAGGSGGGVNGSGGGGSTGPGTTGTAPEPAAGGSEPRPGIVPLGPGHGTCANRQDPALRALVDQALPDAAGAPAALTSDLCLPGGQRLVSIELAGNVLEVSYLPSGTAPSLASGFREAATASGGTVIVPAGYPQLLAYLAPRL